MQLKPRQLLPLLIQYYSLNKGLDLLLINLDNSVTYFILQAYPIPILLFCRILPIIVTFQALDCLDHSLHVNN